MTMNVDLSEAETLALRVALGNWHARWFEGDIRSNIAFHKLIQDLLAKLGGPYGGRILDEQSIKQHEKEWISTHAQCEDCLEYFPKTEMVTRQQNNWEGSYCWKCNNYYEEDEGD